MRVKSSLQGANGAPECPPFTGQKGHLVDSITIWEVALIAQRTKKLQVTLPRSRRPLFLPLVEDDWQSAVAKGR